MCEAPNLSARVYVGVRALFERRARLKEAPTRGSSLSRLESAMLNESCRQRDEIAQAAPKKIVFELAVH
jgi:hypothetical protein